MSDFFSLLGDHEDPTEFLNTRATGYNTSSWWHNGYERRPPLRIHEDAVEKISSICAEPLAGEIKVRPKEPAYRHMQKHIHNNRYRIFRVGFLRSTYTHPKPPRFSCGMVTAGVTHEGMRCMSIKTSSNNIHLHKP